ncbi:MAG: hypothetical protein PVS3B1_30730 [Ktedonobacteraceae bacterium]
MAVSEVAQLREKIEYEIQAMKWGLTGFAAIASHKVIENKYNQIGNYQDQLGELIGETEASKVVVDTYIKLMNGK